MRFTKKHLIGLFLRHFDNIFTIPSSKLAFITDLSTQGVF